jgi:hypothetical protein
VRVVLAAQMLPFVAFLLIGGAWAAAEATSPETVMVVGAVLTAAVLALGLLPRETRTMRRIDRHASHV